MMSLCLHSQLCKAGHYRDSLTSGKVMVRQRCMIRTFLAAMSGWLHRPLLPYHVDLARLCPLLARHMLDLKPYVPYNQLRKTNSLAVPGIK